MNYEQFKELWTWALRELGMPLFLGEPLLESLDLRSTDRHCKSFVHLPSPPGTSHRARRRADSGHQPVMRWIRGGRGTSRGPAAR